MKTSAMAEKAVILAAGEGKRMHPLTRTRPKVMLPIANKPILEHLVIALKQAGFAEFIFVVGYHEEIVRDYFGKGRKWGVKIEYVTQRRQQGTAHAVQTIEGMVGETFLVLNGDVLITADDIYRLKRKATPVMGITELKDVSGSGVVVLDDERIVRILEKVKDPPTNLVNTGVYYFDRRIFDAINMTGKSPRGEYEITESLQRIIDSGIPLAYERLESWMDVSYPWDLLTANERLLQGISAENHGKVEDGAILNGAVSIGKNTTVRSGSYIVGPVIIGENCDIGPNCFIRPSTAIGDECHVGAAVEIKNSILMCGAKAPHLNYVGDSVIGEECNLGAGTKIANLRLDKKDVSVAGVKTGRRKLGAILGDKVETGINACINVGAMIGDHASIGPGALASGVILPNSRVQ